jgi:hypothetical protein
MMRVKTTRGASGRLMGGQSESQGKDGGSDIVT